MHWKRCCARFGQPEPTAILKKSSMAFGTTLQAGVTRTIAFQFRQAKTNQIGIVPLVGALPSSHVGER